MHQCIKLVFITEMYRYAQSTKHIMIQTIETCRSYDKICIKYIININGYILLRVFGKILNYYVAKSLTKVSRPTVIQH